MKACFGPHLVDDGRAADDFGISTGGPTTGAVRPIPTLAHGRCPLLRTRSVPRLLRLLDVILGSLSAAAPKGTVGFADMGAAVRGDRGVLVPAKVLSRSSAVERTFAEAGVAIAETEAVRLDPAAGEIIVLPGLVGLEQSPQSDLSAPEPGAYHLSAVVWTESDHAPRERPATALVRLLRRIADRGDLGAEETLLGLAALAERLTSAPVDGRGVGGVSAVLEALTGVARG